MDSPRSATRYTRTRRSPFRWPASKIEGGWVPVSIMATRVPMPSTANTSRASSSSSRWSAGQRTCWSQHRCRRRTRPGVASPGPHPAPGECERGTEHPSGPFASSARRYAGRVIPETQYARLGDLHLAYQVLGDGPPDILLLDQWFGHVEAQWDVAPLATFRERLASFG